MGSLMSTKTEKKKCMDYTHTNSKMSIKTDKAGKVKKKKAISSAPRSPSKSNPSRNGAERPKPKMPSSKSPQ